ncbi:hypothetical protein ACHAW6_005453 [Cyclotella cf. meneghiniana]
MRLKCAPDIAHVLSGINDDDEYIDDVGPFPPDLDHHVNLLGTLLCHIEENSFPINPLKCEWALGYSLTPWGLKSWKKKIDTILHTDCPWNASELCMFIGCVNYYRDMWPSCAHILKPLTDHSDLKKRVPIPWTPDMQAAFDKMHALMAEMSSWPIQTITNGLMYIPMHLTLN